MYCLYDLCGSWRSLGVGGFWAIFQWSNEVFMLLQFGQPQYGDYVRFYVHSLRSYLLEITMCAGFSKTRCGRKHKKRGGPWGRAIWYSGGRPRHDHILPGGVNQSRVVLSYYFVHFVGPKIQPQFSSLQSMSLITIKILELDVGQWRQKFNGKDSKEVSKATSMYIILLHFQSYPKCDIVFCSKRMSLN